MTKAYLATPLVYIATWLFISHTASANDTSAAIGAGGLVFEKSTQIELKKESLKITPNLVKVRYEFFNTADKQVSTIVAFPLPVLDNSHYESRPYYGIPPLFSDFKVWVDGKQISTNTEIKAWFNGKEVTEVLKKHELLLLNQQALEKRLTALDAEILDTLYKIGLLNSDSESGREPTWHIEIKYYWPQNFLPRSITIVEHSYKPQWGVNSLYLPDLDDAGCFDTEMDALLQKKMRKVLDDPPDIETANNLYRNSPDDIRPSSNIEYILTTAKNWKGPIQEFSLEITGASYIGVCLDGAKYSSREKMLIEKRNYQPSQDLKVTFAGIGKKASQAQ